MRRARTAGPSRCETLTVTFHPFSADTHSDWDSLFGTGQYSGSRMGIAARIARRLTELEAERAQAAETVDDEEKIMVTFWITNKPALTPSLMATVEQRFLSRGYLDGREYDRHTAKASEISFEKHVPDEAI